MGRGVPLARGRAEFLNAHKMSLDLGFCPAIFAGDDPWRLANDRITGPTVMDTLRFAWLAVKFLTAPLAWFHDALPVSGVDENFTEFHIPIIPRLAEAQTCSG